MENEYEVCKVCPRKCNTKRNSGKRGFCGEGETIRVAWAGLHFGEEPPVTFKNGSGTIFISGCNLRCLFCQNFQISQQGLGKSVSTDEFADICIALQAANAENINIVTGSHSIPAIASGIRAARQKHLSIPVLWNSSAYETPEALSLLDGLVDVWLPDLKTLNPLLAKDIFQAENYPSVAKRAIRHMAGSSPLRIEYPNKEHYPSGKIFSGVIVRHLALPGKIADTEIVLRWYAKNLSGRAPLSLMTQYTPVIKNPSSHKIDAFPNRILEQEEFERLHMLLEELDIEAGFYQELVEDTEWLPDFSNIQPFSSALARPIWHYSVGFIPHH